MTESPFFLKKNTETSCFLVVPALGSFLCRGLSYDFRWVVELWWMESLAADKPAVLDAANGAGTGAGLNFQVRGYPLYLLLRVEPS